MLAFDSHNTQDSPSFSFVIHSCTGSAQTIHVVIITMNDFRGVHQRTPPTARSGHVTGLLPMTSSQSSASNNITTAAHAKQRRVRKRIRSHERQQQSHDRGLCLFVGIAAGMIFLVCFAAGNLINYWSVHHHPQHSHNHWDAAKMHRINLLRQELAHEKQDIIQSAAGSRKVDELPANPLGEVGMAEGESLDDGNQFVVKNEPQPIVQGITIKKHRNDGESDDAMMIQARRLRDAKEGDNQGQSNRESNPSLLLQDEPPPANSHSKTHGYGDNVLLQGEKERQERVQQLNEFKLNLARQSLAGQAKQLRAVADGKENTSILKLFTQQHKFTSSARTKWTRTDGAFLGTMVEQPKDRSVNDTNVPFVFMVYKRTEYLQHAMESVMNSDFPRDRLPIVISHDGQVPEVVEYVEGLKKDFKVIQLFHPFACYDHPHSFPGNDTSLNQDYKGDTYGNPRSAWATCCKHHFTWMMMQVFRYPELEAYDTFFFSEEDYIVAPTIYQSISAGLNEMAANEDRTINGFFGLGFDLYNGGRPWRLGSEGQFQWEVREFRTGPMAINRKVFDMIQKGSDQYCTEDEYNWDWSLVHMMIAGQLPFSVLQPRTALVQHIGKIGVSLLGQICRWFQVCGFSHHVFLLHLRCIRLIMRLPRTSKSVVLR